MRNENILPKAYRFLYGLFIRDRFCFFIIGFAFGGLLSHFFAVEWINEDMDFQVIQPPPSFFDVSHNINSEKMETIEQQETDLDNTMFSLLKGLQSGMHLVAKNKPSASKKKVRILYIVGNEGSGHHLWQNIMQEMSKNSKLVNADYVDNNIIMVECLHSCFMEIYHKKKGKLETLAERKYFEKAKSETQPGLFVEYSCKALVIELQKIVSDDNILPDGSLLYLRSFSYPFMGVDLYKMPNIITLINAAQQIIEIDIKLILMKREWVNCIVSACVHRYGACSNRVIMQPAILSMIQSQILSIDPLFWIMIDYEDFVKRPLEYVDIISDWLLIKDKDLIRNALKTIVKSSETSDKKSGWNELKSNGKSLVGLVENLLYSDYAKNMWPIYNSQYFLVTPENRQFLDSKYK